MTTKEVLNQIREVIAQHKGDERELLEALEDEAQLWTDRLMKMDDEEAEIEEGDDEATREKKRKDMRDYKSAVATFENMRNLQKLSEWNLEKKKE